MKLTENQSEFILGCKFCILATSVNNKPRACVVIPEMACHDKVVIADCQMNSTRQNILANSTVFVSFYDSDLNRCIKCDGVAQYITCGNDFQTINDKLAKENLKVGGIIEIKISSIHEQYENG